MEKFKVIRGLLICACVLALQGCKVNNNADNPSNGNSNDSITDTNRDTDTSTDTGADTGNIFESAILSGSVIDFSEDSCSISTDQTYDDSDGEVSVGAAPGNETDDTTVNIKYEENCEFKVATINRTTWQYTLSDAAAADIKKQSSLYLYGSFQDTHNLKATMIIITRYE